MYNLRQHSFVCDKNYTHNNKNIIVSGLETRPHLHVHVSSKGNCLVTDLPCLRRPETTSNNQRVKGRIREVTSQATSKTQTSLSLHEVHVMKGPTILD